MGVDLSGEFAAGHSSVSLCHRIFGTQFTTMAPGVGKRCQLGPGCCSTGPFPAESLLLWTSFLWRLEGRHSRSSGLRLVVGVPLPGLLGPQGGLGPSSSSSSADLCPLSLSSRVVSGPLCSSSLAWCDLLFLLGKILRVTTLLPVAALPPSLGSQAATRVSLHLPTPHICPHSNPSF